MLAATVSLWKLSNTSRQRAFISIPDKTVATFRHVQIHTHETHTGITTYMFTIQYIPIQILLTIPRTAVKRLSLALAWHLFNKTQCKSYNRSLITDSMDKICVIYDLSMSHLGLQIGCQPCSNHQLQRENMNSTTGLQMFA